MYLSPLHVSTNVFFIDLRRLHLPPAYPTHFFCTCPPCHILFIMYTPPYGSPAPPAFCSITLCACCRTGEPTLTPIFLYKYCGKLSKKTIASEGSAINCVKIFCSFSGDCQSRFFFVFSPIFPQFSSSISHKHWH